MNCITSRLSTQPSYPDRKENSNSMDIEANKEGRKISPDCDLLCNENRKTGNLVLRMGDLRKVAKLPTLSKLWNWKKAFISQSQKTVTSLYITNCCISDLTDQIAQFSELIGLYLRGNQLKFLPEKVTELKKLKFLRLSHNGFEKIPEQLGNFPQLSYLSIDNNNIKEVPGSLIKQLPRLTSLSLGDNPIKSLPKEIDGLKKLETLNLPRTLITKLPDSIGNLKKLKCLNLRGTQVKDLPKTIENMDIETLYLQNLSESFKNLEKMKSLKNLYVEKAPKGNLPSVLEKFSELTRFYFLEDGIGLSGFVLDEHSRKCLPEVIKNWNKKPPQNQEDRMVFFKYYQNYFENLEASADCKSMDVDA